jgi:MoxR-like ATPase
MRITLGYPDRTAERSLLEGADRRDLIANLQPKLRPENLISLQRQVSGIHASPALLDYLQALIEHSRRSPDFVAGLSPRAGLALLASARAWALMEGRGEVLPEDVQTVLPGVIGHRLQTASELVRVNGAELSRKLVSEVAIP